MTHELGGKEQPPRPPFIAHPRRAEIQRNNLALFKSRVRLPAYRGHVKQLMLDIMGIEMELKSKRVDG